MYDLGNDTTSTYGIDRNVVVDECETENGMSVAGYEGSKTNNPVFVWEIGEYYYSLVVDSEKDLLTTEGIYAIINSSSNDHRQFENEDLFKETNEKPTLTDIDREVLGKLRKLEN